MLTFLFTYLELQYGEDIRELIAYKAGMRASHHLFAVTGMKNEESTES